MFSYVSQEPDELSFNAGDLLYVMEGDDGGWSKARLRGKEGFVPSNFLSSGEEVKDLTPLHDACRRGNLDLLDDCLQSKVPINTLDRVGNTAIHWACHSGHADCLSKILETIEPKVLSLNAKNRLGDTPLHMAAAKNHPEIVKLLREHEHNNPDTVRIDLEPKNKADETPFQVTTSPDVQAELLRWKESKGPDQSKMADVKAEYADSDDQEEDEEA